MLSNSRGFGENVIIHGADKSSFVHVDDKRKDIVILIKGPTQGWDDIFIFFLFKFPLKLMNSYLFVNGVEIYKFKTKYFEINASKLCFGNISKDFLADNIKKGKIIHICL